MNLRKKLAMALIAAGLVSGGAAQASVANMASGDSSVILSVVDTGAGVSAMFDLGINLSTMFSNINTSGYSLSFDLNSNPDYSAAWTSFLGAANLANVKWAVIAGDSVGSATANGLNYLSTSTAAIATVANQTVGNMVNFSLVDTYFNASNPLGNHPTTVNGSDFATAAANGNAYFAANGAMGSALNWQGKATFGAAANLGVAQSFYHLTNGSTSSLAKATVKAFGFDQNGVGGLESTEYGKWNVSSTGLVTFSNPTLVPEADTWAMFAAGLIAVGAIARRRLAA